MKDLLKTSDPQLPRLYLDWHLFNPLLVQGGTEEWKENVFVTPPALGRGEQQLVRDLKAFWESNHQRAQFKDVHVCLLRNLPRVGIGLFHRSGFYPDFILWLRDRVTKEVNVVFLDRGIATQLITVFQQDLRFARAVDNDGLHQGLGGIFYLTLFPLRDQL